MSAWIVDKTHVDLMVRAALDVGSPSEPFCWWQVDDDGNYAGWSALDRSDTGRFDMPGYRQSVSPDALGQMLVMANVASVGYRYDEEPGAGDLPGPVETYYLEPYTYTDPRYCLSPAEVFGLIDCFDYQSCERPDWRQSEAFQFCDSLRQAYCKTDGSWGWDTATLDKAKKAHPERVDNNTVPLLSL